MSEVKIVVTGQNKSKPAVTDATKDVQKLGKEAEKLPDKKTIKIEIKDGDASAKIDKVKKEAIPDKETKLTAKDEASDTIDKVSKQKPAPIRVPIQADDGDIGPTMRKAGEVGAHAFSGGFIGALAGGDLVGGFSQAITDALNASANSKNFLGNLQNQMGITPAQAREYGDRIGTLYAQGLGDSKDQIAEAYSLLSSDVKNWSMITTAEQDKIVKGAVKIAQAFNVDVSDELKAASSLVANKLTPNFHDAFDVITKGFQTLGSRGDDAIETLNEYAGYFTQLGITAPQALGLIQQGLQAGARDTDFIADVWKEVGIRIIDTATSTKDALKELFKGTKTNIDDLQRTIAAGGPPAEAALEKVITRLQGIKDPVDKNRIGVALFGTQYEDTFRRVIEQTDLAKAKLTEYQGATDALVGHTRTLTEHLGSVWDNVNQRTGRAIDDLKTRIGNGDWLTPATANMDLFTGATGEADRAAHNYGISLDGTSRAFLTLANTVGGVTSDQFPALIQKMSDSDLAALGVTATMNNLGHRVLTMPDGKPIIIDTNSGKVISDLTEVKRRADALPTGSKFLTYFIETVTTNKTYNMAPIPMAGGKAAGGPVGSTSHAAEGGPRVNVTRVNEQGPELGRNQDGVLRDLQTGMSVVPAGQSAQIMAAASGGMSGGTQPIVVQVMLDKQKVGEALIDYTRNKIGSKAGGSVSKFFGGKP